MCGRYRLTIEEQELLETWVAELFTEYRPSFNIAPSRTVPVVVSGDGGRRIEGFRWGLVPSWARDPRIGNRMINARSETVAEKPSFRTAWRQARRCVVPANGFYEWRKPGENETAKVPYSIEMADSRPFGLAGLWEEWSGEGSRLRTFTILTTSPNSLLKPIHDRMPVILGDSEAWDAWLDPAIPSDSLSALFEPWDPEEMQAYPVSSRVNRPGNDGPECVEPVSEEAS
jgi:putative SOS response-associated peptidase YedK